MTDKVFQRAAEWIRGCSGILIGAGAGLGVDSGLPDFRGKEGFWKAYPAFRSLGMSFSDMADPKWFFEQPDQAWGFYGHRLNLYRETKPHAGFDVLKRWTEIPAQGGFVFTSNVDGHFQKACFPEGRVVECHGSIHFLQCSLRCTSDIWPSDDVQIEVDFTTCKAVSDLPVCPHCGSVARPNILMFGDYQFLSNRTDAQFDRYANWLNEPANENLVAVECGAGTAIPTVRYECEGQSRNLIRINPRDPQVPLGGLGIASNALEALQSIDEVLTREL